MDNESVPTLSKEQQTAIKTLEQRTETLLSSLCSVTRDDEQGYQAVENQMVQFKGMAQQVDRAFEGQIEKLRNVQEGFRRATAEVFFQSRLMRRVRTWPEGYPGDYLTLEGVYADAPQSDTPIGRLLDRYFLSRTLAVAVRSRLKTLTKLLQSRASEEKGDSPNWLNLASGPARELLSVSPVPTTKIWCLDYDAHANDYAKGLLQQANHENLKRTEFLRVNAMKLVDPGVNVRQFGRLTTIYSTGLFDYIPTVPLIALLKGLYNSLAPGGLLIGSFKDRKKYETFDYHWCSRWHFFYQREEAEFHDILAQARIPKAQLAVEREETGVILFFLARKA